MSRRSVSVILPTYNERECLEMLRPRLDRVLAAYPHQVIVVDDNSPDGTGALVEAMGPPGAYQLIRRPSRQGLSSAVLEGFARSTGEVIAVMDADGSHPPEMLPALLEPVMERRAEFVLGSRYLPGGADEGLGHGRKLMSSIAAALVRPLTRVSDPMSGFFSLDRKILDRARLAPTGFKIGLEVMVKCRPKPMFEVPFRFQRRLAGESKLGALEVGSYLRHLRRLYGWSLARRASSTR